MEGAQSIKNEITIVPSVLLLTKDSQIFVGEGGHAVISALGILGVSCH